MIINWVGLIVGIGAILLGNLLEGGHLSSLIQPTAALIVFGGTLGATLLSSTMGEFTAAISGIGKVFLANEPDFKPLVAQIAGIAASARKDGLLSLEKSIKDIKNPFFAQHLRQIVDGYDPAVLKEIMEDEIGHLEDEKLQVAKVYETAGGFSPTVGIIGAVLGLIHVMANLSDSSKLGAGIAVAFVATVYGVGSANLVFLPVANKLKKIGKWDVQEMEIIFQGLVGIQNGLNPRVIEERLKTMIGDHHAAGGEEKKAA